MTQQPSMLAVLAMSLMLGLGCSSGNDSDSPAVVPGAESGDATGPAAAELVGEVAAIAVPASLRSASQAYQFDYSMPAVTGGNTVARAQLFEPRGAMPENGYPLMVWAHGTTGIANACAPSLSFEDFGYDVATDALLEAGYAVLTPDYEGFGTPSVHPYFARSSHANAVLAGVSAVHRIDAVSLSDGWAIAGHSQGGHVALATARAQGLADHPLQAVVALAPGTDLQAVSDRAFEAIDLALAEGDLPAAAERLYYLNVYGAYVAHAANLLDPAFDPKSLFGDAIVPLIDTAIDEARCGEYADSVQAALNDHLLFGGSIADFAGLRRNWYEQPAIAARLNDEELGDEPQQAPLLIVQGDADRQVPIAATTDFVDRQRSLGTDISYEVVTGARHGAVVDEEFGRTTAWLAQRFPAR